jgi:hypothetical protein
LLGDAVERDRKRYVTPVLQEVRRSEGGSYA